VQGPGYVHVSPRIAELAQKLLAQFLEKCPRASQGSGQTRAQAGTWKVAAEGQVSGWAGGPSPFPTCPPAHLPTSPQQNQGISPQAQLLSDPDRVLARLDSFIAAYGSRAMLYETWTSNPSLFELLLLLFDRSEFLAEAAIATPDLVDELVLSGLLRRRKTAAEILKDLQHGRQDADQRLWLRRYHQAELMRIGLRDILGLADFEQNLAELTALADGCLQYALEAVLRKNKLKVAPFVLIGLGKLGGAELNYGSDLDLIFVTDPKTKSLSPLQRLAVEVMDFLSRRTEMGIAFVTDARLRPDGEKGLLVNTLSAYEEYYRQRAQLWEVQALTRVRRIAGDLKLGAKFLELAGRLTNFKQREIERKNKIRITKSDLVRASPPTLNLNPNLNLAAYSSNWKMQIARMRSRIEKERTPASKDVLAIKTGVGGLIDAEFIAQALCLENGWQEPNTLRALRRAQESNALPHGDAGRLIENYRQLRRVEAILRRWSFAGETELPDDEAARYRVAVRCGWKSAADFMQAIREYRQMIRSVYTKVFSARPQEQS